MGKYKDERGNRYGLLTVKQYYGTDHNGARWLCECDCGNEIVVKGLKLRSGNTRSCGCLREMPLMDRKLIGMAPHGKERVIVSG